MVYEEYMIALKSSYGILVHKMYEKGNGWWRGRGVDKKSLRHIQLQWCRERLLKKKGHLSLISVVWLKNWDLKLADSKLDSDTAIWLIRNLERTTLPTPGILTIFILTLFCFFFFFFSAIPPCCLLHLAHKSDFLFSI